jgi:predicted nucleic acid-binding protein
MLCLSEPIATEYQRVLRETDAVSEAEERALIEASASGEGVLYASDPPPIEGVGPDPEDDKFHECALELGAGCIASGDSDLLELGSCMGIPILTPRELSEQVGKAPEEQPGRGLCSYLLYFKTKRTVRCSLPKQPPRT